MRSYRCSASALRIRELPGGTDTGRRVLHGQVVEAYGASWDGDWLYVRAPAGEGWSGAAYLDPVAAEAPADPTWPRVPHGIGEIRDTFGEPATPQATAGTVELPDTLPLAWDPDTRIRRFRCHELVEGPMQAAFDEVHRRGLWSALEDFGGCYNDRTARGLQKRSTHAWGIAVDVAARSNPLGRTPTLNPRVVAIFEDVGCVWGGRWSRPDGMHFQWATGY